MKKYLWLFTIILFFAGCSSKEEELKWKPQFTAKILKIEFVGAGGYGSPNAVRIWRLDNGMAISMSDWREANIKEGDVVTQYICTNGFYDKGSIRYEVLMKTCKHIWLDFPLPDGGTKKRCKNCHKFKDNSRKHFGNKR